MISFLTQGILGINKPLKFLVVFLAKFIVFDIGAEIIFFQKEMKCRIRKVTIGS
jgi:hypothetical protein